MRLLHPCVFYRWSSKLRQWFVYWRGRRVWRSIFPRPLIPPEFGTIWTPRNCGGRVMRDIYRWNWIVRTMYCCGGEDCRMEGVPLVVPAIKEFYHRHLRQRH